MEPFLKQIATLFYQEKGTDIERTIFVFPGRRASVFFQQYLSEQAEDTFFAPSCYTISDFLASLAPQYEKEDHLALLFRLYRCFIDITQSTESFDSFMSFGEILLKDFNDIDNYLVDAKLLYSNLSDIKQLEDNSFLSPEQIEVLQRYLGYIHQSDKDFQSKTGSMWSILGKLYDTFTQQLLNEKRVYDGLLHRIICNQENLCLPLCDEIVFVGFNAMDGVTKTIFRKLKQLGIADFYWDYQSPYVQDVQNKAHFFTQSNVQEFPSKRTVTSTITQLPEIHSIAIPSQIGQTKYVASLLQQWYPATSNTKEHIQPSTAIVLANEQLLIPMLYALPTQVPVNITMGYPLKQTAIRKLIDDYLQLQATCNEEGFHHHLVEAILKHPYIRSIYLSQIETLPKSIHQHLRIKPEILASISDLAPIFTPIASQQWLEQLVQIIYLLSDKISSTLDKELLEEASRLLIRTQGLLEQYNDISLQPYTILKIIKQLLNNINLAFIGEPISGIQMMGMLETRCLDFNRLIITSFNEGIYPKKEAFNSYIPYSIRKSFGMPTTEHHDAIYAYNFYRLIGRASQVYLLHDTRNNEQGGMSEVSRFVKQLHYLYKHPIDFQSVNLSTSLPTPASITVEKNPIIQDKINQFFTQVGLSPSVLNTYINCPLQFYFTSIEKLYIDEPANIELQANQMGSIFHRIMELLYQPYIGQVITSSIVDEMIKLPKEELLQRAYLKTLYNLSEQEITQQLPYTIKGAHLLTCQIILTFVQQSLVQDKQRVPFTCLATENKYELQHAVNESVIVKLKGTIDRIDEKDGIVHLYDYKTSKIDKNAGNSAFTVEKISQLFELDTYNKHRNESLQLMFYRFITQPIFSHKNGIACHIYKVRKVFEEEFNATTQVGHPEGWEDVFTERLNTLISDILNPQIPFRQTTCTDNCTHCKFKDICGR